MKLKKSQISQILSKIKSTSVDSIQLKVRTDYSSYENIHKIFKNYGSHKAFSDSSFKLKNANPTQNLTTSILRNQIELIHLGSSVFISSVRKANSAAAPENSESNNSIFAEFSIDINVSKFISDIKDLQFLLKESDIYGDDVNILMSKPKNIMCLLALIYGSTNISALSDIMNMITKDKNKYVSLISNKYTKMLKYMYPSQISIDILYEAIMYYIIKIFNYSGLPVREITISDICISTQLPKQENLFNDGRYIDIMNIIDVLLDYSICATNYISIDFKKEYKSSLDRDAEYMMKEFYKSFSPKSKRQTNFVDSLNTIETNYRGVYKPCGDEYLNGGYAFYSLSKKLYLNDKIGYTKGSYMNRTYGLLLQPEILYTEFPNKFNDDESQIFVMTIKPSSLNRFLRKIPLAYEFKIESNLYKSNILNSCNLECSMDKDKYDLFVTYINSLEQDNNINSILNNYSKRLETNSYITISDMCQVAMKGFILDPLYFLLKTKKNLKLLQETTIMTYLNYFMNTPKNLENKVNILFTDFVNILYNHNIQQNIIDVVREKMTIKELIDYACNNEILSSHYFQDILIISIYDLMPKLDATFVKKSMQFFFLQKLNYYITNDNLKLDGKLDIRRYRKICKNIHRISMNKLLNKNLITYDYYLNETNRMDNYEIYKLKSVEEDRLFDITNLATIIMDILSTSLEVEEIGL